MKKAWFYCLASLVVLGSVGLRLPHLTTRSLWFDEALAANNSRGSLTDTVANTRLDNSSPILYPLVLYATQKLSHSALAVRALSFASSVVLVLLLVVAGKRLIGPRAALIAALMVAVTPSQVHYAQEVREYASSCLAAGAMTLSYLAFVMEPSRRGERLCLWGTLALAPLLQYGLVLYGLAILLALTWIAQKEGRIRFPEIVIGCICLAATGLFSLLFTLRHQLGADVWYLQHSLFRWGETNPVRFLYQNTVSLLAFLTPGWIGFGLVALGLAVVVLLPSRERSRWLAKLVICAGGIAVLAGLLGAYPFGSVRQCLYLAPVVCIAVAAGMDDIAPSMAGPREERWTAVICLIFLVSAVPALAKKLPYQELEASQTLLTRLGQWASSGDDVYIYYGARPTFEFYGDRLGNPYMRVPKGQSKWELYVGETEGRRFIFGGMHRDRPAQYAQEIVRAAGDRTNRLWLVFSHITFEENARIVEDLESVDPRWEVVERLKAPDAALYEARPPGVAPFRLPTRTSAEAPTPL